MQVTLELRYGREDEELMGLQFCNEMVVIRHKQLSRSSRKVSSSGSDLRFLTNNSFLVLRGAVDREGVAEYGGRVGWGGSGWGGGAVDQGGEKGTEEMRIVGEKERRIHLIDTSIIPCSIYQDLTKIFR